MNEISVSFDREAFLFQNYGGISSSYANLYREFVLHPELFIKPQFQFTRSDNYHLLSIQKEIGLDLLPRRNFIQSRSGYSTLLSYGAVRTLSSMWAGGRSPSNPVDIFHATYYRPTYYESRKSKKLAITVHDFIPEKLGWLGIRNPHIGKKALAKKADLIFCVSEQTAQDLFDFYRISGDRVRVVGHGIHIKSKKSKNYESKILEGKSVLYVGHRGGYKNFELLISAIKELRKADRTIILIVAGKSLDLRETKHLNSMLGPEAWRSFSNPSDETLQDLYFNSVIHCVTSHLEGFGMTILESMSTGTPVVLSDLPVFHEVAGTAGIYFNHHSVTDLVEKISHAIEGVGYKEQSILVRNHAEKFSWKNSAQKVSHAYHDVMN
jgi:glycosyltransferase involved in cell wall biosynthesis